jgi:hypothetical protein
MAILRTLFLVTAVSLSAGQALAGNQNGQGQNDNSQGSRYPSKPTTHGVPEIGAVGLGGVAALLVGGTLLIGARRMKRRAG